MKKQTQQFIDHILWQWREWGNLRSEPQLQPRYISAYTTTRHYGGPEEGGWWYNWTVCRCTRPIPPCSSEHLGAVLQSVVEQWCEEFGHLHEGDMYSVLGGEELWLTIEHHAGAEATTERPRYE